MQVAQLNCIRNTVAISSTSIKRHYYLKITIQTSYATLHQLCHSISDIKAAEYLNEREEQSDCEVGEPVDCPSYHECGRPLRLLEKLSGEDKWNPTWNRVQVNGFSKLPLPTLVSLTEINTFMSDSPVTSTAPQCSAQVYTGAAEPVKWDLSKSHFRELWHFLLSHHCISCSTFFPW